MITPPRCSVGGCTATVLHHHPLVSLGRGSGRYRRLEQRPEQWTECNGWCSPTWTPSGAVRPPYRYPARLRDLQRWSDLPEGRVWVTQVRNGVAVWWEVSWRVGDTRRRFACLTFAKAIEFVGHVSGLVAEREVS